MSKRKNFGTIIEIGDILVSEDVILEYFACDYPVCKGRCCIIGDSAIGVLSLSGIRCIRCSFRCSHCFCRLHLLFVR